MRRTRIEAEAVAFFAQNNDPNNLEEMASIV